MVHNLLPNNNKLFKFDLRDNYTCNFCTQSDNKSHLWLCTQAAGLGMIVREILEEHSVQNHKVPWDSLCRLEVDLPQGVLSCATARPPVAASAGLCR